ncbi:zinc carboxypeptidase [Lentithecium fluviatile CBS 122367]|uniref:Zinc carboxypeptidase n=1 Tax=Lentithecium fluviatile CBS 122367 TaxID=1168545 RepID=A0A6G1JFF3_9PLEO|nr:zinc carboxypeptidase [Lentithecium fluviatile CBS 122367]
MPLGKMRFLLPTFALLSLVASSVVPSVSPISYDGYRVYRVKTGKNLLAIREKLSSFTYSTWNHDLTRNIDLVLSPDQVPAFETLGLDTKCLHEDLGASIVAESQVKSHWKRQANDSNDAWFGSYHPYEEHIEYFKELHASFPNQSEWISSGTSYEGRDIYGLHLWGAGGPGKPAVLYHGTVHAREWIAAPVVEYLTLQLISGYKAGDNITQAFLNNYDFYILPFVNPDGFVYSQTTERLWRKNRQPGPGNSTCYGRDINRNWAFGWDANNRGASTNPCSQTYKGEAPSDTPENQGLSAFVDKLRDGPGIKLFIDWHSYGQYILSPYGYNETLYAPELGKWTNAAGLVSEAIRDSSSARTTFTFGPSGATLYTTTGAAPDHVYEVGKADFSYTIELRDTGDYGFVLPPSLIRASVEEQWVGQRVLLSLLDEVFFDGVGPAIYF